jgi:hypothetical protein
VTAISRPTTVEMTLAVELVESSWGQSGAADTTFAYRTDMPLSVFMQGRNDAIEFSRDLLREALERTTAGYGDVRFLNHGLNVFLHNNTPYGYATYLFDRGDLRAFLRATERVIPYGSEALDFDAELDALLKDGAR